MMLRSAISIVALCLAPAGPAAAAGARQGQSRPAGHALRTWAILCTKPLQTSGLEDLLTISLARDKTMRLVDRKHLDLVAREIALGRMFGGAAVGRRRKLGRILKADAMLLLSLEAGAGQDTLRLVICHSRSGARLRVACFPYDKDKVKDVSAAVLDVIRKTRKQFSGGLRQVYGIGPFVSRGLTHRYDHLQRGYANLLAEALGARKGVAVIETTEARQIVREIALTDGKGVVRTVPLFVKGEFEVTAPAGRKPTVTFGVKITGSRAAARVLPARAVGLAEAAEFVGRTLPDLIAKEEAAHAHPAMSAAQQAAELISRADVFARIGAWEHSTGLREAALLLKDDAAQRQTLISEYGRLAMGNWPAGMQLDTEAHRAACLHRSSLWLTSVAHLEYLIRNRQMTVVGACRLVRRVLREVTTIRSTGLWAMPPLERAKKRFLRDVFPLVLNLKHRTTRADQQGEDIAYWNAVLFELMMFNYERNRYKPKDLDYIYTTITKTMQPGIHPPNKLTWFMSDSPGFLRYSPDISEKEYLAFLGKVARSDRPVCRILGRYAILYRRWCLERSKPNVDLAAFQKEATQLLADYRKLEPSLLPRSAAAYSRTVLHVKLSDLNAYVAGAIKRASEPRGGTVTAAAAPPRTWAVQLEPIDVKVKMLSGEVVPFKGKKWRAAGGWGTMQHLINCGKGTDVLWQGGVVAVMRTKGLIEEILVDRYVYINDVKWDGKRLWVATSNKGIWLVALDGKVIDRIADKQDLPAAERGLRLCPIGPGMVLAAGALGPHERLWLAIVKYDGRANVKVFHRATRVLVAGQDWSKVPPDVHRAGAPEWTHKLDMGKKDSAGVILVGRGWRGALHVDLATLKVSMYPKSVRSNIYRDQQLFSRNGRLYVSHSGPLLQSGNDLYEFGGGVWYRVDLKAWKPIKIGRQSHMLPIRRLGVSSHYGLVGWSSGGFYRLRFKDRTPSKTDKSQTKRTDARDSKVGP